MIFVNTSLEIAQARNKARTRVLPEKMVEKIWKDVQKNIGGFQRIFKTNFVVVDNSDDVKPEDAQKHFADYVKQYADKWAKSPIKNPIGKKWVKTQLKLKNAGVKV